MRPIDADALEKYLNDRVANLRKEYGNYDAYTDGVDDALTVVEESPTLTIDEMRPKGHYITNDDGDSCCSECGENYLDITQNYCPNCGAKLGGGE